MSEEEQIFHTYDDITEKQIYDSEKQTRSYPFAEQPESLIKALSFNTSTRKKMNQERPEKSTRIAGEQSKEAVL